MILRLATAELLGGFLALPGWWYTKGLEIVWGWVKRTVNEASQLFALGVWVKNLLVPMYGETQLSGKVISFFLRLAVIVLRGLAVAVWVLVAAAALVIYLLALPAGVLGIFYHGLFLFIL
jgi:hypothetical protein